MTHSDVKYSFLNKISPDILSKLQPIHFSAIDECIELILGNKALINDKKPETIDEIETVIYYHLLQSFSILNGILDAAFSANLQVKTVTLNYRGKTVVYRRQE